MTFTGTCRVVAIFIALGSVAAFAFSIVLMFNLDGDAARSEYLHKAINKNGLTFIIGIALGTLAEISRAVRQP